MTTSTQDSWTLRDLMTAEDQEIEKRLRLYEEYQTLRKTIELHCRGIIDCNTRQLEIEEQIEASRQASRAIEATEAAKAVSR